MKDYRATYTITKDGFRIPETSPEDITEGRAYLFEAENHEAATNEAIRYGQELFKGLSDLNQHPKSVALTELLAIEIIPTEKRTITLADFTSG